MKHGSREAVIEIELQRKPSQRKNPIITRTITREGNQSTYLLNGKKSGAKELQHLAQSFNIHIDNLCQFLPQDKVVEFAQLSPIDLLASTQRAVAGPEMTKYHEDLKKLRASQCAALKVDQEARELLTREQGKVADLQPRVEQQQHRAKLRLKLDRLGRSRTLLQYASAKRTAEEAKAHVKILTQDLKNLRNVSAPTLVKMEAKAQYKADAQENKAALNEELTASLSDCKKKAEKITEIEEDMQGKVNQIEAEKKSIATNRKNIARDQAKVRDLRRQKAEAPESFNVAGITNEITTLRNRSSAAQSQINRLEQTRIDLFERLRKQKADADALTDSLETFGTQASQQGEKLKVFSRATFEAWDWIQKNQDQFSQQVYGPAIIECSLKDPGMADAIESLLGKTDFTFITAQNSADFHLLQRKLFGPESTGGLGLHDVSLRECRNPSLEQFRPPLAAVQMERLGLSGWAIDCLQGPEAILVQLCHEKKLHQCGYSPGEPTQQQHEELVKTDISSYITPQKIYHFLRRKEYGAAGTSARVIDVSRAKVWTNQPVDLGRKAALERDVNEARGELAATRLQGRDVQNQVTELKTQKQAIEKECEAKKDEKAAKQRARMEYEALDVKIATTEEAVQALQESLQGVGDRIVGLQEECDESLVQKVEAVLAFAAGTREVKSKTATLLEAEVILIEAVSDHQIAEAQNNEVVQTIRQKVTEQTAARQVWEEQVVVARGLRDEAVALNNEGRRLEADGDSSFSDLLEHVCQNLKTEANLDAEIEAEAAGLALAGVDDNADLVKNYEKAIKNVADYEAALQDASKRQEEFKHGIADIRGRWEPRLDDNVSKINDAFSDSFARIGCAGQVAVHKASSEDPLECTEENGGHENGLDFDHWAIHISVKFRESEPLSLLDSHRQSGGERAVSTIFYLMALQSLSRAPFRVVDEINQGMDPRNERMVHGRMVDIAADNDGGSQYFLITPKLLSGLKYRRGMTVLCIVSGENVPAARERDADGDWQDGPKVDFRHFVKRARELGIAGPVGKRIDSGMSLGRSFTASQSPAVGA